MWNGKKEELRVLEKCTNSRLLHDECFDSQVSNSYIKSGSYTENFSHMLFFLILKKYLL